MCVDELEGMTIQPPFATGLVERVALARRIPLRELSPEQLRVLTSQRQSLTHVLPIALEHLEHNPLSEGDFYRGDLLMAVLDIEAEWVSNALVRKRVGTIVEAAVELLARVQATDWSAGEFPNPDTPDETDHAALEHRLKAALERF